MTPSPIRLALWLALAAPAAGTAQETPSPYRIGMRSMLLVSPMRLSRLNPTFNNLEPFSSAFPHASGLSLTRRVRSHLDVGVATLVANSTDTKHTTMQSQGIGVLIDALAGDEWVIGVGGHAGGIIASAMADASDETSKEVRAGLHYKGNGFFVAPQARIGHTFGTYEAGVVGEQTLMIPGATNGLKHFGGTYIGAYVTRRF